MDTMDEFLFPEGKIGTSNSFLTNIDNNFVRHFEPNQYPVVHYYEQLYLEHALIVATHTVWKFLVQEDRDSFTNFIQVSVCGNFEPFNEPHLVNIPVTHCQSAEEFETLSKARRVINDVPTWKAYHLPPVFLPDPAKQNSTYCVVLSKPQKWGSQMMPVKFFFRGSYSNKNAFWEKWSSPAIMLTNSASKWYEKAFITLALVNIGYDAKLISKPDAMIRWDDFMKVIDLHVIGTTGCQRKLSDKTSVLSQHHIESILDMVQYENGNVTLKKVRYFCNESQDGTPPLKYIEALINRYKQSWETGAIVGIIRSSVVKQYLLENGHPIGSFVLRIQFHSPGEICASSVQAHPQTGAVFVDHLTISQHVAPDDQMLQDYLASSPIHQLMLPMQILCTRPVSTTALEPSKTYRTTDQELQRTNLLLQQAYKEGFQPQNRDPNTTTNATGAGTGAGASNPTERFVLTPSPENRGYSLPSPQSPGVTMVSPLPQQSPAPPQQQAQPANTQQYEGIDEQVLLWLRCLFKNDSEQVLNEVIQKFVAARVTSNSLYMLDANDLKEMGIAIGPRKLLVHAIQQINVQYQNPV